MIRTANVSDSANIAALSIQVWLDTYATEGIRQNISKYVLEKFTEERVSEIIASDQTPVLRTRCTVISAIWWR